MTYSDPIADFPPKKWCGCYHYVWCNHQYPTQTWPSTTTTLVFTEKPDDGYVGRHRKEP